MGLGMGTWRESGGGGRGPASFASPINRRDLEQDHTCGTLAAGAALCCSPLPSSAPEFCPRHGDQRMDASDPHGMLPMDSARYVPYFPAALCPLGMAERCFFSFWIHQKPFLVQCLRSFAAKELRKYCRGHGIALHKDTEGCTRVQQVFLISSFSLHAAAAAKPFIHWGRGEKGKKGKKKRKGKGRKWRGGREVGDPHNTGRRHGEHEPCWHVVTGMQRAGLWGLAARREPDGPERWGCAPSLTCWVLIRAPLITATRSQASADPPAQSLQWLHRCAKNKPGWDGTGAVVCPDGCCGGTQSAPAALALGSSWEGVTHLSPHCHPQCSPPTYPLCSLLLSPSQGTAGPVLTVMLCSVLPCRAGDRRRCPCHHRGTICCHSIAGRGTHCPAAGHCGDKHCQ